MPRNALHLGRRVAQADGGKDSYEIAKDGRETYYRLVLQKRGRPAVKQLIEDIRLIWPAFGTELHDPAE